MPRRRGTRYRKAKERWSTICGCLRDADKSLVCGTLGLLQIKSPLHVVALRGGGRGLEQAWMCTGCSAVEAI